MRVRSVGWSLIVVGLPLAYVRIKPANGGPTPAAKSLGKAKGSGAGSGTEAAEHLPPQIVNSVADLASLGNVLPAPTADSLNDLTSLPPESGLAAHFRVLGAGESSEPTYLVVNRVTEAAGAITTARPLLKNMAATGAQGWGRDLIEWATGFDPQFSPNGHYVLFKFGTEASPGLFRLFVHDLTTGQTRSACPLDMTYYAVSWSPDGRYIAFGAGGEVDPRIYDYGRTYSGRLGLSICDWRTGRVTTVIKDTTIAGPWTWLAPHTLLYGRLTSADAAFVDNPNRGTGMDFEAGAPVAWERLKGGPKRVPPVPNVYAYSTEEQSSRMLCSDAYRPLAAPDGKHLAFFGSADTKHPFSLGRDWTHQLAGKFVIVTDFTKPSGAIHGSYGANRRALSQHYIQYPLLLWLPDSRHLLVMSEKIDGVHHDLVVRNWDTLTQRLVKEINVAEIEPDQDRSINDPVYRAATVSGDGRMLTLSTSPLLQSRYSWRS